MENSETRIGNLEVKINSLLTLTHFTHELIQTVAKLSDENFSKMNIRIDQVEQTLNNLSNETYSNFSNVEDKLSLIKSILLPGTKKNMPI